MVYEAPKHSQSEDVDAHRAIKGFFLIRLLSVNIGIPKQTTQ